MKKILKTISIFWIFAVINVWATYVLSSDEVKQNISKWYIISDNYSSLSICNDYLNKYNTDYPEYKRSECFINNWLYKYFICEKNNDCTISSSTTSSSNVSSEIKATTVVNTYNSVPYKEKLDNFLSKIESTKDNSWFLTNLDNLINKFSTLSVKYNWNAQISAMIEYIQNELSSMKTKYSSNLANSDLELNNFLCELTDTCSENSSSTITITPTLSVDKSSANPWDTVIFSWSANWWSDCYASINNSNAGKLSWTSWRIPVQNIAAWSYNASISCLFNWVLKTSESVDIIVKTSSIASSSASSNTSTSSSTSTSNWNSSTTSSSTSTSIWSSWGMKIIESYLNNSNYIVTWPQNVSMYSASSYSLINWDCSKAQELAAAACKDTNKGHIWTKDGAKFSARWMDASVTLSDNVNGTAYNLISSYLWDYECSNNQIKYRCEWSWYIIKNKSSLTFSIDKYSAKIWDTVTLSYDIPENYNSCTSSISYWTDNSSITWWTSNTNKLYDELMSIGSRTGKKSLTVNKQNVRSDWSIYLYFNCYDSVNKQNVNKEVKIKVEWTSTSTSTSTSTAASTSNSNTSSAKSSYSICAICDGNNIPGKCDATWGKKEVCSVVESTWCSVWEIFEGLWLDKNSEDTRYWSLKSCVKK